MFGIESDSDIVACPYNKAHRILRKRLQTHLIRCRNSHPDVELRKCPFNVSHLIPEPEYVNHVATCRDRKLITQYMYNAEDRPRPEEIIRHKKINDEENWDDTEAPDLKPKIFIKAENIKTEKKPNVQVLKRELSRSRSRSPVYRPGRSRQEEIDRLEEIWDGTEAPAFKPKILIKAENIKAEMKPNIQVLKRELSRSRSRSPRYRPGRSRQEGIIKHEKIKGEEIWDDTEASAFKPKILIKAENIKTEMKPNIQELKRELSRSRSRSPV